MMSVVGSFIKTGTQNEVSRRFRRELSVSGTHDAQRKARHEVCRVSSWTQRILMVLDEPSLIIHVPFSRMSDASEVRVRMIIAANRICALRLAKWLDYRIGQLGPRSSRRVLAETTGSEWALWNTFR